jgi:MFS family permease
MADTTEQTYPREGKKEVELRPLYVRSVINSLSQGMVSPFTGVYAVKELGASSSDMGWFQSTSNLTNNVMQLLWGRLSDRLKRRVPFIVIGGLIVSALYAPMIFVDKPYQLIIILAVQALLGSMATPAWTALIGDLVPSSKLGRANAALIMYAQIGGLVATLGSGIIMYQIGGSYHQMLTVPVIVATVFGAVSSLFMLRTRERKSTEKLNIRKQMTLGAFDIARYMRQSPSFLKYCYVMATYEFFMSISWPLFSITQVTILGASPLQIALLSVVQMLVMILFQRWAGRRADVVGRKPLLIAFRFILVTVPLAYAFTSDMNILLAMGLIWGFAQVVGQTAVAASLLDTAPQENRGSFIAAYNLIIGVVTFFGSLSGGYLTDYLTAIYGLVAALQIVYVISAIGRIAGATLLLTLKETLKK